MLDLSAIGLALNWWLVGSYRAGELIVYTGISVFKMLINAVKSFNEFGVLLYEGSTLWLQDINEFLCALNELVRNGSNYLLETVFSLAALIAKIIHAPISILVAVVSSLRELLVLLGSSCLFLISLPPLFLFYFIDTLLHIFNTLDSFARLTGQRITEHTADLRTLEIIIGFVAGCGLIILLYNGIKFFVKWYFKLKPRAIKSLRLKWRRLKTMVITRRTENDDCKLKETESCIVCLSKARSVCLLPCRHLCLCVTCTQSLPYPLKCPLCRQRTEDLIHVFI